MSNRLRINVGGDITNAMDMYIWVHQTCCGYSELLIAEREIAPPKDLQSTGKVELIVLL